MTLNELAKKIGVSSATVSLVLNNKGGISEETRSKVLAAAKQYGFEPSRAAPTKTKKNSICLAIYRKAEVNETSHFFSVLIENIEYEAARNKYSLNISYLNADSDIGELTKYDGVILLATTMDKQDLLPFLRLNIPLVALDNSFPSLDVNSVSIANRQGMASTCNYLIVQGHKKIGFVTSRFALQNFDERLEGAAAALRENSMKLCETITIDGTGETAYAELKKYFDQNTVKSTALIFANDALALSAIRALKEKGIQPGKDIAMIGVDDLPYSSLSDPPLSTVKVYNNTMGIIAMRKIVELVEDPSLPYVSCQVGTKLILRESSQYSRLLEKL